MKSRAYSLLVANAVVMVVLAVVCSQATGVPLRDPDGYIGPSWLRIPILLLGAFLLDIVPRTLWRARGNPKQLVPTARELIRSHWTRDRIKLVVIGLICFYATYVSYRNLKNFLPFIRSLDDGRPLKYDNELHKMDLWMLGGHDPAVILHNILGTGPSAYVLSWVYLLFLPLVPIMVIAWVVWSGKISYGYWFVTADCMAWSLGTLSYYLVPSLGPNFQSPWLYDGLPVTGVTTLQDSLSYGREGVLYGTSNAVQSVAGFASLHVAITLMTALVAHYTLKNKWLKILIWADVVLTTISTTYFGWHYIADDIAGVAIAVFSVWIGAIATGHVFTDRFRRVRSTTETDRIPVDA